MRPKTVQGAKNSAIQASKQPSPTPLNDKPKNLYHISDHVAEITQFLRVSSLLNWFILLTFQC